MIYMEWEKVFECCACWRQVIVGGMIDHLDEQEFICGKCREEGKQRSEKPQFPSVQEVVPIWMEVPVDSPQEDSEQTSMDF